MKAGFKHIISFGVLWVFVMHFFAFGQQWTQFRHEMYIGGGPTTLLGDLGGSEMTANRFLGDINPEAFQFSVSGGYKYRLNNRFKLRGEVGYIQVSSGDSLTLNVDRNERNLHVRTRIIEVSPLVEFYIIPEAVPLAPNAPQWYRQPLLFSMYIATGITALYFNPQAELNGQWHSLQPLGTEGQGIKEGTRKYSRVTAAIPLNLGFKFDIPSKNSIKRATWNITLEFCARWALTDYLDDVSTEYYDLNAIREQNGLIAAQLSDRRKTNTQGNGFGRRGNADHNDFYGMIQLKVGKHIRTSGGRSKNFINRYNGYSKRRF